MNHRVPFLVALPIETSLKYGRELLRGIQRFIKSNSEQDWIAVVEQRGLESDKPDWLRGWSGHGVISRYTTEELKASLRQRGIPFVDTTDRHFSNDGVAVLSDDHAIGQLGAEHLNECVLPNFAFCGYTGEAWSKRRADGFFNHPLFEEKTQHRFESNWFSPTAQDWELEKARLIQWLQSLPKPIGIMACNDIRGKQLIDACFQAGISVPEQVAVVGVDNDELLCDFCHTPLTSIMPNAEEVGYQAALALSKMLANPGERSRVYQLRIPPLGVVVRRSSDIVAVNDPALAHALKVIRDEACTGITVNEVVSRTEISRSSIERKFREVIGRTPQQEIRRIQLNRVCTMLTTTDLAIDNIATQCGFEHPEYLHVVFKRMYQITPGEFRSKNRS